MINQSVHFDVGGSQADLFMQACLEKGVTPVQAFSQFVQDFITKSSSDTSPYNKATTDYLLSDDKQKGYQKFSTVEALFADLEAD